MGAPEAMAISVIGVPDAGLAEMNVLLAG